MFCISCSTWSISTGCVAAPACGSTASRELPLEGAHRWVAVPGWNRWARYLWGGRGPATELLGACPSPLEGESVAGFTRWRPALGPSTLAFQRGEEGVTAVFHPVSVLRPSMVLRLSEALAPGPQTGCLILTFWWNKVFRQRL